MLAIDFTNEGEGGRDRVAVELSADLARALVERILAALAAVKPRMARRPRSRQSPPNNGEPPAVVPPIPLAQTDAAVLTERRHALCAVTDGGSSMRMIAYLLGLICVIVAVMYFVMPAG